MFRKRRKKKWHRLPELLITLPIVFEIGKIKKKKNRVVSCQNKATSYMLLPKMNVQAYFLAQILTSRDIFTITVFKAPVLVRISVTYAFLTRSHFRYPWQNLRTLCEIVSKLSPL